MAFNGRFPAPPQQYQQPPPAVPQAYAPPPPSTQAPQIKPGTLPPGTVVVVGEYTVTIDRYLSEGGFAHVYLANSPIPLPRGSPTAGTKHVLKRMVVQDKKGVEEVGREVDVMRQLKNHPKIVNMIEASVADLPGGVDGNKGYEIYILMEWCPGGGIIDMMNTRLQNRLTESEILKIFSDVVEAVAHMHYQSPPLIHRDLKVENILLTPPQTYKLCDFGSTTKPLPREKVPSSVEGLQKVELEINKTTTLQYRAPELVDVWGRKGFDEKIDIWALGVFLYKLCFYTTPFEEHGPLAILNAQYKFPPYPAYSNNIRSLIASMLLERASQRPNIYQVHEMVCKLRGAPVRLENKYANLAPALTGSTALSPATSPLPRPPTSNILSSVAAPPPQSSLGVDLAGTVSPMRRGRPGKSPAIGEDTRQTRTGLATVGNQGEKPLPSGAAGGWGGKSWQSFASSAKSPVTSGFDSAPQSSRPTGVQEGGFGGGGDGFGDAFSPSQAAAGELETSVQLPANAAMFAELVPPPPSKGGEHSGRKSPMDLLRKQQVSQQSFGGSAKAAAVEMPKQTQAQVDEERRRFEATFPDLDSVDAFSPSSLSAPPPPSIDLQSSSAPQLSLLDSTPSPPLPPLPKTGGKPSQLTGETPSAAGPPLPRRTPTSTPEPARLPTPGAPSPSSSPAPAQSTSLNPSSAQRQGFKPELVSRGSQTSPHLLASWRGGSTSSTSSAPSSLPSGNGNGAQQSALRQSSVPELELLSPAESPVLSPANGGGEGGKKVVDLLGDDDDSNFDALAPRSAQSALPSSSPADAPSSTAGNVASKRMSFSSSPAASSPVSTGGGGEREKFRPQKRTSWLPSSASPSSSLPGSPKPPVSPKPVLKEEQEEEAGEKGIEERFPALQLEEATPRLEEGREEKWEKVVEKEDVAGESSEDEAPSVPVTARKVAAPDFDDDDFAPRPILQSSYSSRPRFGSGGFKTSTTTVPTLSTSPQPFAPSPLPSSANNSGALSPAPTRDDSRGFSTSSSSSGGGGIDLGPALASIRKFAPSGNNNNAPPAVPPKTLLDANDDDDFPPTSPGVRTTLPPVSSQPSSPAPTLPPITSPSTSTNFRTSSVPLTAPRPTSAKPALTSLVSRYENLPGGPLTGGPPPLGAKPVGLRKDSNQSSTSAHGYQRDEVKPRALPQWGAPSCSGSEQQQPQQAPPPHLPPKPSTPTSFSPSASRAPFKPVPPPSSPSSSPAHARGPSYSASSAATRASYGVRVPLAQQAPTPQEGQQDEEEEKRFEGVSNMKSRWETMARQREEEEGQIRRAAGAKRKEWAAV